MESGAANPTLSVLLRVASALRVSLEELVATPRASCQHFTATELVEKKRGQVTVRQLLPDPLPGLELERLDLPAGARMVGVPHTRGTREYLTCERGRLELWVAGEQWQLGTGDIVVFPGDQKHSYVNPGRKQAIGYSVITLARAG